MWRKTSACARQAPPLLEGSIAALGSQYVLGLRAKNCTTGDMLADEQAQAARKEDVLSALSQIATRFRTRVGESLATIEQHSTPLEEATTPSLEALKAYSAGRAMSGGWHTAMPLFQRAVAIDPDFAMAHAQVGFGYSTMGESASARPSTRKAYELRDRASDVERFFIETLYDRDVTGNLEREQRTLETWAESYPRDALPHGLIAGLAASSTGKSELAIAEADKAIALDPDMAPAYSNKAFHQLLLNRPDDALLTVGRARERNLNIDNLLLVPYFVAFLKGTDDELRRTAEEARKDPLTEDIISHLEALALARAGRLQDARRMAAVPVELAQRSGRRERAGLFEAARAVWEAFYGNAAAARQSAAKALELGRGGREVNYAAAFALALAGDLPQSRALAEDLAREFPEDTSVQFMYLPTLRALFSLNTHVMRQRRSKRCRPPRATTSPWARRLHRTLRRPVPHLRPRPGVSRGASARRSRRRVPEDSRSSQHRARRSHGRDGAPAAGTSARALGRHREGEERLQRSLDALEERRRGYSGSQGGTGGIRTPTVSDPFLVRESGRVAPMHDRTRLPSAVSVPK